MFELDHSAEIAVYCGIICLTTFVAGIMSGLTLSLFSLDETYLKALADGGPLCNPVEKKRAQRVLSVVSSPHWLLVTLLLCNAAAIETMPMVIDEILNPAAAIAISVVLVLIFGEVIPQALFIRHALVIGGFFAIPLKCVMVLTSPISWTVGKLLDVLVGHREAVFFRRRELREFLLLQQEMILQTEDSPLLASGTWEQQQQQSNTAERDLQQRITKQEINIMLGTLSLSETEAEDGIKTRIEEVVSLCEDDVIGVDVTNRLFMCGFSRIPVFKRGQPRKIVGYLITKSLISLIYEKPENAKKVSEFTLSSPHRCRRDEKLSDVYLSMQAKQCHICIVEDDDGNAIGIITAHDILERIHQTHFTDETDLKQGAPVQMIIRRWDEMQYLKAWAASGASPMATPGSAGGMGAGPRSSNFSFRRNQSFLRLHQQSHESGEMARVSEGPQVRRHTSAGTRQSTTRTLNVGSPTSGYGAMM